MRLVKSIVVVISGRGSNMAAIMDSAAAEGFPLRVAAVLSNRPDAPGLAKAVSRGVQTRVIDHTQFADRDAFDAEMARAIDAFNPDFVVLAEDPHTIDAEKIKDIKIVRTVVGGTTVYSA